MALADADGCSHSHLTQAYLGCRKLARSPLSPPAFTSPSPVRDPEVRAHSCRSTRLTLACSSVATRPAGRGHRARRMMTAHVKPWAPVHLLRVVVCTRAVLNVLPRDPPTTPPPPAAPLEARRPRGTSPQEHVAPGARRLKKHPAPEKHIASEARRVGLVEQQQLLGAVAVARHDDVVEDDGDQHRQRDGDPPADEDLEQHLAVE
jgi:hypothetical protein